jgi:hypothetical protein
MQRQWKVDEYNKQSQESLTKRLYDRTRTKNLGYPRKYKSYKYIYAGFQNKEKKPFKNSSVVNQKPLSDILFVKHLNCVKENQH